MNPNDIWKKILPTLEGMSYICVVLGIGFAAIQYVSAKQETRSNNALTFVQGFQAAELMQSRLQLQRRWLEVPMARLSDKSGSAEVIDELATEYIFSQSGVQNVGHLIAVIDYLNVAAACANKGVCEDEIIEQQLGTLSRSLFCLYRAPIQRLRQDGAMNDFGSNAEKFFKPSTICPE